MTDTIQKDKVVSLAYTLTVDGEVYEEWDAEDPFEYLHGAENVVPGLEAALQGRTAGDKLSVTVPPEEGYGDYDPEDFQEFEKSELPDAEVGMPVMLEDEEGYLFEGLISEIAGGKVKVDFNPPLAGKTLIYEVEILAIRDADEEELAHGHAQGMAWSDDEGWDDDEE